MKAAGASPGASRWSFLAVAGSVLLFGYLTLAAHSLLSPAFRLRYWILALIVIAIAAATIASRLRRSGNSTGLMKWSFLSWSVFLTLLAVDTSYAVYFNTRVLPQLEEEANRSVPVVSSVELRQALPRVRYGSSLLYKPDFAVSSPVFGDLCTASDLVSETIRDEVAEIRDFDIRVNEEGFRESVPFGEADAIILGDSFAFGSGLASNLIVATRLTEQGIPCYNAGYDGCGLVAQANHLEWLMEQDTAPASVPWIIWTVFEGNDLEDSIDPSATVDTTSIFDRSIVGGFVSMLESVRDHSVLARAVTGRLYILNATSHRVVDGIHLRGAFYNSARFGPKLFHPPHIERALQSAGYVNSHVNIPRIENAMDRIDAIAKTHGSQVLVVLIPSAVRVHGASFEDFPEIEPPYFLDKIRELATDREFQTVDLVEPMKTVGQDRLLYFKDDTHWNAAGHEIAFQQLLPSLSAQTTPSEPAD